MLKNYLKIAIRNLLKNKTYSAINIIGLATGMAIALLIGIWIWDEITFDNYHQKHGRIAQVWDTQTWNGQTGTGKGIDIPLASELSNKYGDNFKALSLSSTIEGGHILAFNDKRIIRSGIWAQPQLPGMLTLKMVEGSQDALKDPLSVLLSQSTAQSLFGEEDPINKILQLDNKSQVKVAGVFEDLPPNTSLYDAKFFLSWDNFLTTQNKEAQTQWGNHGYWLFVEMNDNIDFDQATARIRNIPQEHIKEGKEEIILLPMDKWHLYSSFENGKVAGGRIQFVWLFGAIGVFVLLLACINFMNLSTARSEKRAKEVGIRKTVGSLRRQLIGQFLCESIVVALIAFVLAMAMVVCSFSFFNSLADKRMTIPWTNAIFWSLALGFTVFTGLISGCYPAFYLSNFKPVKILKGTFHVGKLAAIPRKVLVVVQFSVSIILIIGTIIVFRQIQFAKSRPIGYTREGLVSVPINTPELLGHYDNIRNDLLRTGAVKDMAESSSPATSIQAALSDFSWTGKEPGTTPLFGFIGVTHDFGSTIGWKVVQGRDFSREYPTDSGAFILTEAAVKLMKFSNPIGQIIRQGGAEHRVIGVVKDIVMESPYSPVDPIIFVMDYRWTHYISMRINPYMSMHDALAKLEPVFKKYNPGSPFEYQFIDEEFAKKFSNEQRIGDLATFFAIFAIFISSMGLFGLASFVAEQRIKEIGVRKVLGASVFNLWTLLSRDFLLLVFISCFIATPIAWYYLSQWLQKYEYRMDISPWIFALVCLGALMITILTVSFQTIRAALSNPIKSLRTE
jgi:ABC-type antimicrobial peptide transport system permease subunit